MATNDAADLNSKLTTQLRDSAHATWATGEKDILLAAAVASLYPRFARPLDPTSATIALVASTYHYALPTGVRAVARVDRLDTDGEPAGPLSGRSWEVVGDVLRATGKLHVSPTVVQSLGTLQVKGYGTYNVTTDLIPDDFAPLVLAKARAEAYRRVGADRERFKAWLGRNQVQNVSVNELLQIINEADNEARQLEASTPRTWMGPVPGRQG